MNVPIHFAGVAKGTKEGGLLELLYRSIEITCLPKDIPDEIVIDITHLGVGESLHFKDVQLPETLNANMSDVTTIAAVRAPKKAEQPAPAGKKAEGEDAGSKSETSED